jgi:hypothetical protein
MKSTMYCGNGPGSFKCMLNAIKVAGTAPAIGVGNPVKSPFAFPMELWTLNRASLNAPHARKTKHKIQPIRPNLSRLY